MRLSLVTAYEALERSGYVENRTAATQLQRIGTWYGQAADDYREVNQGQEVSTYYIPGGCRAFGQSSTVLLLHRYGLLTPIYRPGKDKLLFQVLGSQLQRRYGVLLRACIDRGESS